MAGHAHPAGHCVIEIESSPGGTHKDKESNYVRGAGADVARERSSPIISLRGGRHRSIMPPEPITWLQIGWGTDVAQSGSYPSSVGLVARNALVVLELIITPNISGGAGRPSLKSLRVR